MARLPRLALAGHPHHLIQRGNNDQAVVVDTADRQMLLDTLGEQAQRAGVALHAYVILEDHFHVLATPPTAEALSLWMQAVGRRYVRHFNDRHGRRGTLWEGRYRGTVLQAERYFLPCMAYIDQHPVRAGLVEQARGYAWSSHGHYVGLRTDRFLTPHALYWALGNTPFAREAAYAEMVHAGPSRAEQLMLTEATRKGWAAGDAAFVERLQADTPRRLALTRAGRKPRTQGTSAAG
ncbi:transposase [uncultured Pseudacidovorax sp.]|uniref:transposase n=1 Tax=uncultured Pseudacidovorax sp. TaxID=679313 RepID=UPI0025F60B83|nr:transposase [uncultured Pseudacidovorax sp.]